MSTKHRFFINDATRHNIINSSGGIIRNKKTDVKYFFLFINFLISDRFFIRSEE